MLGTEPRVPTCQCASTLSSAGQGMSRNEMLRLWHGYSSFAGVREFAASGSLGKYRIKIACTSSKHERESEQRTRSSLLVRNGEGEGERRERAAPRNPSCRMVVSEKAQRTQEYDVTLVTRSSVGLLSEPGTLQKPQVPETSIPFF